ncbi:2-iminobutanoate/2-iminopropanoate deaminase-like, partial [Saccoglossus kowalevskii]
FTTNQPARAAYQAAGLPKVFTYLETKISDNDCDKMSFVGQAIVVDRTMYISGQIGQDFSGKLVSDNIREQTEQTLKNMGGILNSQGADFSNVIKTTVLLSDMKNYPAVNEVYKK